jgi:hypothetical protein
MAAEDVKRSIAKLRAEVIAMFGGKCMKCGYHRHIAALQVDHIDGGGTKQRMQFGNSTNEWRHIRDNGTAGYQLLCANCNLIKKYENGEAKAPPRSASALGGLNRRGKARTRGSTHEEHRPTRSG